MKIRKVRVFAKMEKLLAFISESRINKLKNSYFMQGLIVVLTLTIMFIYFGGTTLQLSSIVYILEKNTRMFQAYNGDLSKIQEYTVSDDGSAEVVLKKGKIIELDKGEYNIAFIKRVSKGESWFHEEDKTILQEIPKNYGVDMLWGSKIYFVMLFMILSCFLIYIGQRYKMSLLGSKIYFSFMTLAFIYATVIMIVSILYFIV